MRLVTACCSDAPGSQVRSEKYSTVGRRAQTDVSSADVTLHWGVGSSIYYNDVWLLFPPMMARPATGQALNTKCHILAEHCKLSLCVVGGEVNTWLAGTT